MTTVSAEQAHAAGTHAAPEPSCSLCQEALATEARRRKENRQVLLGIACLILAFALVCGVIWEYVQ